LGLVARFFSTAGRAKSKTRAPSSHAPMMVSTVAQKEAPMSHRPPPLTPDFIRSIPECAASVGIDDMTLRRLIQRGQGPATIRLSPGRLGIRDSAWNAWLASRETASGANEQPAERLAG
jgi:predicted DNA-binding transcriptional regulator AlpA